MSLQKDMTKKLKNIIIIIDEQQKSALTQIGVKKKGEVELDPWILMDSSRRYKDRSPRIECH